jgi:transglycosylase-like protein with SLT domain
MKDDLKNKIITFIFVVVIINTFMTFMLFVWINEDRKSLKNVQTEIRELKDVIKDEIKFREELFPKLEKSAKLMKKYNPSLDHFTAVRYAYKIFECSDKDASIDILTALIVVESSANFRAVSHKGALGLTQVMPNIWNCDKKILADPYKNIEVGSSILKHYINRHGLMGGLSAYNCGKKNRSIKYAKKVVRIANKYF